MANAKRNTPISGAQKVAAFLLTPDKHAAASVLKNLDNIEGSNAADLMIGNSEQNYFYFKKGWGRDIVFANGGNDFLDFTDAGSSVTIERANGVTYVTSGDDSVTVYGFTGEIIKKAGIFDKFFDEVLPDSWRTGKIISAEAAPETPSTTALTASQLAAARAVAAGIGDRPLPPRAPRSHP